MRVASSADSLSELSGRNTSAPTDSCQVLAPATLPHPLTYYVCHLLWGCRGGGRRREEGEPSSHARIVRRVIPGQQSHFRF